MRPRVQRSILCVGPRVGAGALAEGRGGYQNAGKLHDVMEQEIGGRAIERR